MPSFRVSSRPWGTLEVDAPNWLCALGLAVEALRVSDPLDRIAAETLPNGTILARDVRTGSGFVVVPLGAETLLDELTEELAIEIGA